MGIMEVIKAFLKAWVIAGSGVILSSCQTVDLVYYEHNPSQDFYKNLNIVDPAIKPFLFDEVVFVIDANAAMENYLIWLTTFSEAKNKRVKLLRASISGNGLSKEAVFDSIVNIDNPAKRDGLFRSAPGALKLFTVDSARLREASHGGISVKVRIVYDLDGVEGTMEYDLKRRVEKHVVFPT